MLRDSFVVSTPFFMLSFGDILTSVDFKQMDRLCSQFSVKVLWDWPMTTLTDESHEMWKIDELGVACWVFGKTSVPLICGR